MSHETIRTQQGSAIITSSNGTLLLFALASRAGKSVGILTIGSCVQSGDLGHHVDYGVIRKERGDGNLKFVAATQTFEF